jgi:hypothetical protein
VLVNLLPSLLNKMSMFVVGHVGLAKARQNFGLVESTICC